MLLFVMGYWAGVKAFIAVMWSQGVFQDDLDVVLRFYCWLFLSCGFFCVICIIYPCISHFYLPHTNYLFTYIFQLPSSTIS